MKKIYTFAALVIALSTSAQNFSKEFPRADNFRNLIDPNPTSIKNTPKFSVAPGHLTRGVLALGMIGINNIPTTDVRIYTQPIYFDSTVVTKSATNPADVVSDHRMCTVFDPVSIYYQENGNQLLSNADPYTVDSLWVGARYQRVKHTVVDTLLVELAWGPTNSSTVWTGLSFAGPPSQSFRSAKINSSSSHGNVSFLTAPTTNKKTIKYALTDVDTNKTTNNGYIVIPNVNQLVPAGNKFVASVTFVPGNTVTPGSCVFDYVDGSTQTENCLLGKMYSNPNATGGNPGPEYYYDPTSYSLSYFFITKQRYGLYSAPIAHFNSCHAPTTYQAWDLGFSVSYANSTVGVNEIEKLGFELSQNIPNPFTEGSFVNYQIDKDAKSAIFTVTDVTGRVITTENVSTQTGKHSIKLNSYASGIYYYSLNVDGRISTKKMIVE